MPSKPPIKYAYDPLPAKSHNIRYCPAGFPTSISKMLHFRSINSTRLDPLALGLPYHSSLDHVRSSKHWDANLDETLHFLNLLAMDGSASDIEVKQGITLSKLAKAALQPGYEFQMVLITQYIFPGADEERMRHLAALTVMYFVFDDKVEETPNDKLRMFRDDFFHRLQNHHRVETSESPLQDFLDSTIQGVEQQDAAGGDGGKEMIEALKTAFTCVHPSSSGFESVSEYLHFRRQNVGAPYVVAAVKYSIKSSVSVKDARFKKFLDLFADHLGIVNDLASYDKELRALDRGEASDMINLVDVIKSTTGLQSTGDAKEVAWALQIQMERLMREEVEKLKKTGDVTDAEWSFLEAILEAAAGHVMFCVTTSRYGGEAARIYA